MNRLLGTALALGMLLGVAVGPAAQLPPQGIGPSAVRPPGFGQTNLPAYSPYLNLLFNANNNNSLLGGNQFMQNYYGLVLPQVNTMSALQNLQNQAYGNQQAITGVQTGAALLPPTGHATTFMNTGRYFMNRSGQGALGTGGQTIGAAGLNRLPTAGGSTIGSAGGSPIAAPPSGNPLPR